MILSEGPLMHIDTYVPWSESEQAAIVLTQALSHTVLVQ